MNGSWGVNPGVYVGALALIQIDPTEMGAVARQGTVDHRIPKLTCFKVPF
jgi:hypothetical protein